MKTILFVSLTAFFFLSFNSAHAQERIANKCCVLRNDYGFSKSIKLHNRKFKIIFGGCTGSTIGKGTYEILHDSNIILKYTHYETIRNRHKNRGNDTLSVAYDSTREGLVFIGFRNVNKIGKGKFLKKYFAARMDLTLNRRKYSSEVKE